MFDGWGGGEEIEKNEGILCFFHENGCRPNRRTQFQMTQSTREVKPEIRSTETRSRIA